MREIKFRAWNKNDKVMGVPLELYELVRYSANNHHRINQIQYLETMQYTGLKDKNGVEIYEGDIVQWWNKVSKPKVVEATNGGWNPFIDYCTTDHPYHYEVIGNIYENPELKEATNE